jgi:hypothetical protein
VIQVDAPQGRGGADTAVVSAPTRTQRGAAWAPRSRLNGLGDTLYPHRGAVPGRERRAAQVGSQQQGGCVRGRQPTPVTVTEVTRTLPHALAGSNRSSRVPAHDCSAYQPLVQSSTARTVSIPANSSGETLAARATTPFQGMCATMANPATRYVTATIRAGRGVPSARAVTPLLTASTRSMNNARVGAPPRVAKRAHTAHVWRRGRRGQADEGRNRARWTAEPMPLGSMFWADPRPARRKPGVTSIGA